MKRFERLEDGRIKVRKRNKKKPFLVVREIKTKKNIDCYSCDLLEYCDNSKYTFCDLMNKYGVISSYNIFFKDEDRN